MGNWAIVTGPTAGIGAAYAKLLASKGFNLVLVSRDLARLEKTAAELAGTYAIETQVISADLTTELGIASLEEFITRNEIEVLINNAGFGLNSSFVKSSAADEQGVLNILVTAPMRLTHAVLPQMVARKSGTIVNVSSVAGYIAGGHYSAAKSYVTVLTESVHAEVSKHGVKVSALCPGFTKTEFHQRAKMKMDALPKFMWLDAEFLVAKSWADVQAGKAISIPGWQYRVMVWFLGVAPRAWVRRTGISLRSKQR
ncbi:MAG: SDR family NAD(P)-dependent oxidoreductase [Micrococcales bacterium]